MIESEASYGVVEFCVRSNDCVVVKYTCSIVGIFLCHVQPEVDFLYIGRYEGKLHDMKDGKHKYYVYTVKVKCFALNL